MKNFSACMFLLAALLAVRPATAQTRRAVQDTQLWASLQTELALKNGGYLLLELHGENVTAYNNVNYFKPDRLLGFDQRGASLGYEYFWNDHWSGGGNLQYESVSGFTYLTPELLLRHRSQLGPLTFGQRLSAYRVFPFENSSRLVTPDAQNYGSLRFDLERVFPLAGSSVALRPRLSYEAVLHARFQKIATDSDERTIQYTSLRGEVGCRVGSHFDFTPWVAYTTAYYFVIGQSSNPAVIPTGNSRLNLVTPVFGLDARFTLFEGKAAFERRQLPTQH